MRPLSVQAPGETGTQNNKVCEKQLLILVSSCQEEIYLEALAACREDRREVRLSDEENMPKLGVKDYQILCMR